MTCGCSKEPLGAGYRYQQYEDSESFGCLKCNRIFCTKHAEIHKRYKGTKLFPMTQKMRYGR